MQWREKRVRIHDNDSKVLRVVARRWWRRIFIVVVMLQPCDGGRIG